HQPAAEAGTGPGRPAGTVRTAGPGRGRTAGPVRRTGTAARAVWPAAWAVRRPAARPVWRPTAWAVWRAAGAVPVRPAGRWLGPADARRRLHRHDDAPVDSRRSAAGRVADATAGPDHRRDPGQPPLRRHCARGGCA